MNGEMKKVWITGAKGHVGSALVNSLDCKKYEIFQTDISDVDVTNRDEVQSFMRITRPDIIINCAALTDVTACEENPDEAYRVNAVGARNLAMEAETWECKMIQLSTDDVFGSEENVLHNEFDKTAPRTIYGKSKYAGEAFVSKLTTRYVIIRSSWVYGIGKDFVNTVLEAAKVGESFKVPVNQYSSPTNAKELARVIAYFIDHDLYGIYHVVCKGSCSRYEFAKEILKDTGLEKKLDLIPVEKKDGVRPCFSVLDTMMLRMDGIEELKDWRESLKEYLEQSGGLE